MVKIVCAICGHHEPKTISTVLEIDGKPFDTCLKCKGRTQPFLKFLANSTGIKLDYQWENDYIRQPLPPNH